MKKPAKIALDQLLVERSLAPDLQRARSLIMAGEVIVEDHCVDKAGTKFRSDVVLRLRRQEHNFVSRGGLKLEHALKRWNIDATDAICMDVGASTGGFSEVLLQHGAKKVYAIDVGYGQLAHKLRIDKRVVNLERTHILKLDDEIISPKPSLVVIDLSFISLTKVLGRIVELLSKPACVIALVKPQFEASKEDIGEGGIVTDDEVRKAAVEKIKIFAQELGFVVKGVETSPICGAKGNVEYLLALFID